MLLLTATWGGYQLNLIPYNHTQECSTNAKQQKNCDQKADCRKLENLHFPNQHNGMMFVVRLNKKSMDCHTHTCNNCLPICFPILLVIGHIFSKKHCLCRLCKLLLFGSQSTIKHHTVHFQAEKMPSYLPTVFFFIVTSQKLV
ncbi:hypothetical protein XELAEV_18025448mg [Xenopus laevis]|uniref:Uncharacterized protein n=1 Tax=Xenopus laevis TaxID=8355 RepID=A0A974CZT6_XENLA|nr:hypothetical protein XELAEV_18025448mg [Xenopus laevis]